LRFLFDLPCASGTCSTCGTGDGRTTAPPAGCAVLPVGPGAGTPGVEAAGATGEGTGPRGGGASEQAPLHQHRYGALHGVPYLHREPAAAAEVALAPGHHDHQADAQDSHPVLHDEHARNQSQDGRLPPRPSPPQRTKDARSAELKSGRGGGRASKLG
jgi:hypothetical protein